MTAERPKSPSAKCAPRPDRSAPRGSDPTRSFRGRSGIRETGSGTIRDSVPVSARRFRAFQPRKRRRMARARSRSCRRRRWRCPDAARQPCRRPEAGARPGAGACPQRPGTRRSRKRRSPVHREAAKARRRLRFCRRSAARRPGMRARRRRPEFARREGAVS